MLCIFIRFARPLALIDSVFSTGVDSIAAMPAIWHVREHTRNKRRAGGENENVSKKHKDTQSFWESEGETVRVE